MQPPDETRRLEALRAYGILDTPPEAGFEHITSLAARLFRVPVAAVTLVDAERQWFKSARGLEVRETPRDLSFCAHAMWDEDVFTVPDARLDPRFADNPMTRGDRGWRFYAGAPVRTPEGLPLGALCLADYEPRQFGPTEKQTLKELAALVQDELLLRCVGQGLHVAAGAPSPSAAAVAPVKSSPGLIAQDEHSRQLIEQASDAIFIYDLNGRFVEVNKAACTLTGYSHEELLGLGVGDIEASFDPDKGPQRWREMAVGEAVTMEGITRRKDGSLLPAEARISVVETRGSRHLLALVRDVSERRRAEQLLRARAHQQQAIAALGAQALGGQPLEPLFNDALRIVSETLNLELCRVLEHLPEQGGLVLRAGLNVPADALGQFASPDGRQYVTGHVLQSGEPVIVRDFLTETRFRRTPWLDAEQGVCGLSVPIGGGGSGSPRYGILAAYSREPREFTGDDVYFVHSIANVLAAAIARQRGEDALRAVEARYLQIAANTSGMVFHLLMKPDRSVTIPFVSDGCRQLYELEPAEMQADPRLMHRVVHPEDKENYRTLLRRSVETLEPFEWEGRVLLRSGTVRWVTARSHLDRQPNGDVIWNGVVLDVTAVKQAQQDALAAKVEAERANAAKSEFLSRMSHELRTPLNAILGFGQLLEMGEFDEQDSQCVQYILKGGRHLLSLVDEVLDLSRAEAGELALKITTTSFGKLMQECAGLVGKIAQARAVTCTPELDAASRLPIRADEQRLRQVLLNLLANAIKYNREGGQVVLTCEPAPGGRVRCHVRDTGPGITPDGLERLFVPFQRLEQEFGDTEGTGLGLVVSKRLAEAMDGAVGVESQPGVGSTFWIEMPAAGSGPEEAAARSAAVIPAAAGRAESEVTVLYIEDNLSNLQVIKSVLLRTRPGWRFLPALNGVNGLEQARVEQPDVVLLDLQLPGMNGDAVLTALRADPATARIPVLMLSADATAHSRERLLALGADGYLPKPFNIALLLEKLDAVLRAGRR